MIMVCENEVLLIYIIKVKFFFHLNIIIHLKNIILITIN